VVQNQTKIDEGLVEDLLNKLPPETSHMTLCQPVSLGSS